MVKMKWQPLRKPEGFVKSRLRITGLPHSFSLTMHGKNKMAVLLDVRSLQIGVQHIKLKPGL